MRLIALAALLAALPATTLAQTPANGWALYGLARSEAAQGNADAAATAEAALRAAWLGDRRWLRMDRL